MSPFLTFQIVTLAINLLICCLIWNYYRERTFPAADRYLTFGPRFWTGTIDACVLAPVSLIAYGLYQLHPPRFLAALTFVGENLAWVIYTIVLHARCGQTVGKMVTKVRVVDFATEGPISWRQACIREGIPASISIGVLGYQVAAILAGRMDVTDMSPSASESGLLHHVLGALPVLWFVAEVVTMFSNPKRRALHDLLAGTVVVRTNITGTLPAARELAGGAGECRTTNVQ